MAIGCGACIAIREFPMKPGFGEVDYLLYVDGSKVRVEEAIEAADRTNTVAHILLVHDPGFSWRPDIAHKIADATGGRVIEVSSEKLLQEAFDQISQELRSEYAIGYYLTNAAR